MMQRTRCALLEYRFIGSSPSCSRLITTLSLLKPLPTFLEKSMRANRIALRFIESLSYKNIEFRER